MTKIAVIQAASVPYDPAASVEKASTILRRVADQGARLAVFPEAFIGGYPKGIAFGTHNSTAMHSAWSSTRTIT